MRTDKKLAMNGNALVRALLGGGSRVWGFPARAATAFATLVMLLGSGLASADPIKYTMTFDKAAPDDTGPLTLKSGDLNIHYEAEHWP